MQSHCLHSCPHTPPPCPNPALSTQVHVVRSLVTVMEYAAARDFTFAAATTVDSEGAALNDVTDLLDPAFMQAATVVVRGAE